MVECDGMSMASSGTGLLVFSDDKTEAAGRIMKCTGIYSLPRFRQMQKSWLGGASLYKTQNIQQKQPRSFWR